MDSSKNFYHKCDYKLTDDLKHSGYFKLSEFLDLVSKVTTIFSLDDFEDLVFETTSTWKKNYLPTEDCGEKYDDTIIISEGDIALILPLDRYDCTIRYYIYLEKGKYTTNDIIKLIYDFYNQKITKKMLDLFLDLLSDRKSTITDIKYTFCKTVDEGTAIMKNFPFAELATELCLFMDIITITNGVYLLHFFE